MKKDLKKCFKRWANVKKLLTKILIEELAKNLAKKNGTKVEAEFKKLAKQKVLISGVPYLFSIGIMGFFVAGISNLFTKFRYQRDSQTNKAV